MSDLISRIEVESVLHNNLHALIDTDQLYQLYKNINRLPTNSIPSADIMESAREIKDYCEGFPNCEGCRFFKDLPFRCVFVSCPQGWDLPEEKKKSCNTCKNNDDEFSGECYECVKNIQNHYKAESEG